MNVDQARRIRERLLDRIDFCATYAAKHAELLAQLDPDSDEYRMASLHREYHLHYGAIYEVELAKHDEVYGEQLALPLWVGNAP